MILKTGVNASENQKTVIAQKRCNLFNQDSRYYWMVVLPLISWLLFLPENLQLTVITNSIPVVNALFDHPNIEVILAGGRIFKSSQVTMGIETMRTARKGKGGFVFYRGLQPSSQAGCNCT
jgi:DeoR/GlpR family transcriptional regulator of sugar metabolism